MDDEPKQVGARYGLTPEEKAAVGRRLDEIAMTFDPEQRERVGWKRLVNFPPPKHPKTAPDFVDRLLARKGLR